MRNKNLKNELTSNKYLKEIDLRDTREITR